MAREGGSCSEVVLRVELFQEPLPDAGLQQPQGWGQRTLGVSRGDASHFCPKEELELPWLVQATWGGGVGSSHPHPTCSAPGTVISATLAAVSISKEVGDWAKGPWGQVPSQLLQLTQQAFHFCLQMLHRLLHRLEQGEGWGGAEDKSGAKPCLISHILRNTWQSSWGVLWGKNWVPRHLGPPNSGSALACLSVSQMTKS